MYILFKNPWNELGYWYNGERVWNLDWRRSFFDWEKSLVEQLFQSLQEVKLVFGEADSWVWKIGESQTFSVNSAYVQVRRVRGGEYSPVYSKLWRCKALPSALFTAWRVLENRIASRVNLVRRGVAVENLLCCLCGEEEESSCHLFFVCRFAWRVWCLCFKWLGVSSVIHKDPKSNFSQFRMSQASVSVNEVWSTIWVGIVSEIWKHRNSVIFNRGVADVSEVFALVQVKVWSWIYAKSRSAYFPYSSWVLNPLACMRLIH
ncbi:uncharacterized protein [Phaseolus vulgaris]|uniref:uncharacterized protein n=1 Tax=Phaseolus vulgaris TaxID=3885 RepID=UPI0035C9BAFE